MFFATYTLTSKGPLAKVWLAAHWEKKLTAKDVKVIDLKDAVLNVTKPTVPIALRTSGELMLGIVRIYALKVAHLLKDASDATSMLLKPRAMHMVKVPVASTTAGKTEMQNAVAITMDITVGRMGVEQMCDADFGDVADLLGGSAAGGGAAASADAGKKGGKKAGTEKDGDSSWWFATEASQTVDELQFNSRHDAEMAKFKAELDKSSASGSKKGSSSTGTSASAEQGRAAGAGGGAAADLDIGVAAGGQGADLLGDGFMADMAGLYTLDQVLDQAQQLPDFDGAAAGDGAAAAADQQQDPTQQQPAQHQKKLRMVIVTDAETSLKPDQLKRIQDHRGDIVNSERRHGPLDDAEVQDRAVLGDSAIVAGCEPLSCFLTNDALRAAYHTAVHALAAERISEMERLRGGARAGAGATKQEPGARASLNLLADGDHDGSGQHQLPPAAHFDDDFNFMQQQQPDDAAVLPRRAGKRRGRRGDDSDDDEEEDGDGFSASTLAVLAALRDNLLAAGATSTTLRAMIQNKKRQEACRTFVDLLHLASHQFVAVAQKEAFGSIVVTRGSKFMQSTG